VRHVAIALRGEKERKIMVDVVFEDAPLLIGRAEFAKLLGLSLKSFSDLAAADRLPAPIRLTSRPQWALQEIREWVVQGCPAAETWRAMRQADNSK
jgi:predicted DNA-binding transcriptional regulator AlpA